MFVAALASALLHSLWQFTLIAIVLWSILKFIPTRNANTRYLVCLAGLAVTPLLFIITFKSSLVHAPIPIGAVVDKFNGMANSVLICLWVAGVGIIFAKRMHDWQQIRRLSRQPVQTFDAQTSMRFDRLLTSLRISKKIRSGFSACVKGPCTFGFFKPVILLPLSCLTHLNDQEIEAILAHELAHIKRADFLFSSLQVLLEALFFYHPAVKFISAQISTEREHACDDLAVQALGQTAPLARGLLKSGLLQQENLLFLRANSADRHKLLQRVRRLSGPQKPEHRNRWTPLLLAVIMLTIITSVSMAFVPESNLLKSALAARTATLSQAQIIFLKDDICAIFEADGIYQDPKYGGPWTVANVVFSNDSLLMNGQPLPPSTHKAVRKTLSRYGLSQFAKGHLQYSNPDVSLVLW